MKIVLKKIKKENIVIIQTELLKFIRHKVDNISNCNDYEKYCNDIIVIDVLQSMFYTFRTKIENPKKVSSIAFTPSQAVILLFCCQWKSNDRTEEQKFTMQTISDLLHEKLINI
jgi:hypothetical protein